VLIDAYRKKRPQAAGIFFFSTAPPRRTVPASPTTPQISATPIRAAPTALEHPFFNNVFPQNSGIQLR